MIQRLRASRPATEEAAFYRGRYPDGYRHDVWADHVERIEASARFIRRHLTSPPGSITDLSCGDAALALNLKERWTRAELTLGDLSQTGEVQLDIVGLLPGTLDLALPGSLVTDLYLCSETLEHVDDPDELLSKIRSRSQHLFLSTPHGETLEQGNEEHYWAWDATGIRGLLLGTGWRPQAHSLFTPASVDFYTFQFWLAS